MDIKKEPIPYQFFTDRLGYGGKLSVAWVLLNKEGEVICEDEFASNEKMPMASTMKVPLALCVLKKIFEENQFQLGDSVQLLDADFVPGAPWNTLDRYYFSPFDSAQKRTVDELLTFMLTESDNTSSDKLLSLVGGVDAVNTMMQTLNLDGFHLTSTIRQLLKNYYKVDTEKTTFWNSMEVGIKLLDGFTKRDTEDTIFAQNHNVCQPRAMVDLLTSLNWAAHHQPEEWLGKAAQIIFKKMENCKTGFDLVRAGAAIRSADIHSIADKTGSMGGILNDIALIRFKNETVLVLAQFSSHSPLAREKRTEWMMKLSRGIIMYIEQDHPFNEDRNEPVLKT